MFDTNAQKNIAGIYSLEGVMETSSAFQLNSDSGFEFYFSYGALDRHGSGKWSLKRRQAPLITKRQIIPFCQRG
jgi:hypothetical protein